MATRLHASSSTATPATSRPRPVWRAREWARTLAIALRNVLLGGNAASLALLARPGTLVEYASESLFLFKSLAGRRGLPEANVFEVLHAPTSTPIELRLERGTTWASLAPRR